VTVIEAIHDDCGIVGFPLAGDQLMYHWSPADRREQITARGLRIRSESAHAPIRYPMICLSPNPLHAWAMSGGTFVTDGVDSWDLWAVYADDIRCGFEVIPNDDRTIREIRVYRSLPASAVHHVGTRVTPPTAP
jgi:hypothetical protein